ncbi:MAG: hypothetical protein LBE98_02405 [Puniceicoccales bacterium]|jgi:hypothetical protein|nr:hypothetical protein [Puniceicoccales bacterium]
MDIFALANRCEQQQAVQQQQIDKVPEFFGDVRVSALLEASNRCMRHTSGDGHNNCGFNAILEQVGDRTSSSEMVNALRYKLGYGDESGNQGLDGISLPYVADFFDCPVVDIRHKDGKITMLAFFIPAMDGLGFALRRDMQLSEKFVQYCKDIEWLQDGISQWLTDNMPGVIDLNAATLYDVVLQLLRCPTTIAFITIDTDGHFDAAPHKDLQRGASVLQLLRAREGEEEEEESVG